MTCIKLDLHRIYNNSRAVDDALQATFDDAMKKKIREVEILSANNHGQLLKKVERFLQQPGIKRYYQRMENDNKRPGKLVVHFKF